MFQTWWVNYFRIGRLKLKNPFLVCRMHVGVLAQIMYPGPIVPVHSLSVLFITIVKYILKHTTERQRDGDTS